jgi:hypothetical protein
MSDTCRMIWYDARTGDILRLVRCPEHLCAHQPSMPGQRLLLDGFPNDDADISTHRVDLRTRRVARR